MGMRSSDTAQIFFEDVRVPAKNIIGQEGMGFTYQMLQVRWGSRYCFIFKYFLGGWDMFMIIQIKYFI